jgi:excisionase family DNA binding protein
MNLLTTWEAGLLLQIPPETVREACRERRLPAVKKSGRFLVEKADLVDWAARTGRAKVALNNEH